MSQPAGPLVRLPYALGERVYHRVRLERVPGMVTGFLLREGCIYVLVAWGDDLREGTHGVYELTREFEPSYCEEVE